MAYLELSQRETWFQRQLNLQGHFLRQNLIVLALSLLSLFLTVGRFAYCTSVVVCLSVCLYAYLSLSVQKDAQCLSSVAFVDQIS